jgi:predicted nucleic acid-binding protein
LELEAECVVSGDSDLLELGSYMGIPILMPGEVLEKTTWSRSSKKVSPGLFFGGKYKDR